MALSVLSAGMDRELTLSVADLGLSVRVSAPRLALLSGGEVELQPGPLRSAAGGLVVEWTAETGRIRATARDTWSFVEGTLERRAVVSGPDGEGARLESGLTLPPDGQARFFVPGMAYSPEQWTPGVERSFADSRIAYPVVARWTPDGVVVWLARVELATEDLGPERQRGQSDFLHRTDIGSVGFVPGADRLLAAVPYREGDASAMLDAAGTPAAAFAPLTPEGIELGSVYRLGSATARSYTEAVAAVFADVLELADPTPTPIPVPLDESIPSST